jgi:hypothetical protein
MGVIAGNRPDATARESKDYSAVWVTGQTCPVSGMVVAIVAAVLSVAGAARSISPIASAKGTTGVPTLMLTTVPVIASALFPRSQPLPGQ